MRNRRRVPPLMLVLSFLCLFAIPAASFAQNAPSNEDIQKANNPLADLTAFNVQNYYSPELFDIPNETSNTAWLRYVKPFGRWLFRASLPVPTVPTTTESLSGLGDLNAFAAYVLTQTAKNTFGVGPLLVAPTATDEALGADKWQGGAAAVLFKVPSPQLQWGGLVTWQASFAGDDAAADTNVGALQPFLMLQLGKGLYLRSAPIWTFDFENDVYVVPVGFGIGKILKVGSTVFNMFIEPQFTIYHQGVGVPALQVFTGLNLQFTGGKKKKKG